MNEKRIVRGSEGFTLVEVMVVLIIGILLLAPVIRLLVGSFRMSYEGFDRLENLNVARFVLERVSRDLKFFCFKDSGTNFLYEPGSIIDRYAFTAFPAESGGVDLESDQNPVNIITYEFDRQKRTLTRIVRIHPIPGAPNAGPPQRHVLGTSIVDFQIQAFPLSGCLFQIRVKCVGPHPQREKVVELQAAVRSMYYTRDWNTKGETYASPSIQLPP